MAAKPPPVRLGYRKLLYVSRPGGAYSGDAALSMILAWVHDRIGGRQARSICRLEAPPGYGKSWTLERFVRENKIKLQDQLLIFGPFTPPAVYDAQWRTEQIAKHLLSKPYSLPPAHFRHSGVVSFQDLMRAFMEDVERLDPPRHLLFVLDDVDQVQRPKKLEELEEELLGPIAQFSLSHAVSLLLALRSDFGFSTVELLRRPSQLLRVPILPFQWEQAQQQLLTLAAAHHSPPLLETDAGSFIQSLMKSLPQYTWGVPALNATLFYAGVEKRQAGSPPWTSADIFVCLLNALRLEHTDDNNDFLKKTCNLRWSNGGPIWRIRDLYGRLGITGELEAAGLRDKLNALNLIETPPKATYGAYQLLADWNSIFEACALLP